MMKEISMEELYNLLALTEHTDYKIYAIINDRICFLRGCWTLGCSVTESVRGYDLRYIDVDDIFKSGNITLDPRSKLWCSTDIDELRAVLDDCRSYEMDSELPETPLDYYWGMVDCDNLGYIDNIELINMFSIAISSQQSDDDAERAVAIKLFTKVKEEILDRMSSCVVIHN